MVAHAFDVLGAEHQMNAQRDVARILHHVGQEFAEQSGAERVDLFIAVPHHQRRGKIAARIGVEHLLEQRGNQLGHMLHAADQLLGVEIGAERDHALADVLGMVADPLQIVAHPHGADDLAQIDGHRLPAGNGEDRLFLDLMLHRVDGRIGGDHLFRELLTYMMEDPRNITFCMHLMFCAKDIERIGDHATNIAETVYYMIEGRPIADQRPKGDTTTFGAAPLHK